MTSAAAATLSVRDVLLQSAAGAAAGRMDDIAYLGTDIGMYLMADYRRCQNAFADVPVDRVVALGRVDFLQTGDTWRMAVSGLTCQGWTERVFDYFEEPLLEEHFPAPNSLGELKLSCLGGLCQVSCGNHRLVAGRAWLTDKYGQSAYWRQAKVQSEPLSTSGREMLHRAAEAKTGLRVAHLNDSYVRLAVKRELIENVAALSNDPTRVYAMGKNGPMLLKEPWHRRLLLPFRWTFPRNLRWRELPAHLVERMLDDQWITTQLPP